MFDTTYNFVQKRQYNMKQIWTLADISTFLNPSVE